MNYGRPELRNRLASEYVLGTLHGHARKRFQRLLRSDQELRAAVESWEQRLVPLASPLSVSAPAARVWQGIAARVAPQRSRAAARPGFFERWFGIRNLAPLAAGLVVGAGTMLMAPVLRDARKGDTQAEAQLPQSYVGFLQDSEANPTVLVSSLRHGKFVDIKILRPIAVGSEQVLRLWALPKEGPPFALGVIPAAGKGQLTLGGTSEQLLTKVGELAVSVEPKQGGVPAKPSGPFILRGPCVKLW